MGKKGLIEKTLYGSKKEDFNKSMLQKTRFKQFFYIIKNNYLKLFYYNLLIFLFFMPSLLYYIISNIYVADIIKDLDLETLKANLLPLTLLEFVPQLILVPIAFMLLSGMNFIIRKMLFDEVYDFKRDYKKGFKYSGKQFAFIGFGFTLFLFVLSYAVQYLLLIEMHGLAKIILICLVLIIGLCFFISIMYMMNLSNLYVMDSYSLIKSSLMLTFKELPKNFMVLVSTVGIVFCFMLFSYLYLKFVSLFLLLIFGFIYILLAFSELSLFAFDKYINQKDYPDYYRKGLQYE